MATHRYIISAGHRNADRGGAHREIDWTYPISVKLKDAIHRRGGKAWIIQEEDGDNDPSFSIGRGLQNVARLCVDLDRAVGGTDAYISMHYEGVGNTSVRGFFAIFPDSPQGGVDVRANNALDYRLAQVIARHVEKTGMPKRTGWVVEPGVMSERQSGVGGQGYRLGEFVGTLGFRDRVPRLILEAGAITNPQDAKLLWNEAWQNKYVEAIVDGLEATFGKFKGGGKPAPTPEPSPEPEPTPKPQPTYEKAAPVPALQNERPYLLTDGGALFVRADLEVEAVRDTPRLKYAGGDARVGPDVLKGQRFSVDYLIVNNDGSLYWLTPWASRIRYDDTRVIEEA